MTSPGSWYPKARAMQRTIIFHMGPTNSGKTFQVCALPFFVSCSFRELA